MTTRPCRRCGKPTETSLCPRCRYRRPRGRPSPSIRTKFQAPTSPEKAPDDPKPANPPTDPRANVPVRCQTDGCSNRPMVFGGHGDPRWLCCPCYNRDHRGYTLAD